MARALGGTRYVPEGSCPVFATLSFPCSSEVLAVARPRLNPSQGAHQALPKTMLNLRWKECFAAIIALIPQLGSHLFVELFNDPQLRRWMQVFVHPQVQLHNPF